MMFRSAYDGLSKAVSDESAVINDSPSLTQQHLAEECDINTIVRRFGLTGQVPVGMHLPTYGDFSGVSDYQTALNSIMAADAAFMEVPADVRARFKNDPQQFVEFCSDPANLPELRKLGLAPEVEAPALAPVSGAVSPAPAGA